MGTSTGSLHRAPRAPAGGDQPGRLIVRIVPDDNVRLANLRSGDIDFMHLVARLAISR